MPKYLRDSKVFRPRNGSTPRSTEIARSRCSDLTYGSPERLGLPVSMQEAIVEHSRNMRYSDS